MTYQKDDYAIHPDLGLCRVISVHTVHKPGGKAIAYQRVCVESVGDDVEDRLFAKDLTPAPRLTLQSWGLLEGIEVGAFIRHGPEDYLTDRWTNPEMCEHVDEDGAAVAGGYDDLENWRLATPLELVNHDIIDELPAPKWSGCCGAHTVDGECVLCGEGYDEPDTPTGLSGFAAREAMGEVDTGRNHENEDHVAIHEECGGRVGYHHTCQRCGQNAKGETRVMKATEALDATCAHDADEWVDIEDDDGSLTGAEFCLECGDIRPKTPRDANDPEIPEGCDQPRDANGEVLGVGDIVAPDYGDTDWSVGIWTGEIVHQYPPETYVILSDCTGGVACDDPSRITERSEVVKKLRTITPNQYRTLARRTVPDDWSLTARLMEQASGLVEEMREFLQEPSIDEAGDVLWYATMLLESIEEAGGYEWLTRRHKVTKPRWDDPGWARFINGVGHRKQVALDMMGSAAQVAHARMRNYMENHGRTLGEARLHNIKKLYHRHPEGFELGGGRRGPEQFTDLITTGHAPMHDGRLRAAVEAGVVRVVHCAMSEDGEPPMVFVREVEG